MAYMITLTPDMDLSRNGVANLLFNLGGGLPPEYLTQREVALMVKNFGENWKQECGYTEPSQQLLTLERKEAEWKQERKQRMRSKIFPTDDRNLKPAPIRVAKCKKPCKGGCGSEGHVIPSGVFDSSHVYCAGCYNHLYPSKGKK